MPRISQLIPRTHWTTYGAETERGSGEFRDEFCIWKMWLGRSYDVTRIPLV